MIYPSVEQLSKGIYNRYELVIATAKAARLITEMQIRQKEEEDRITIIKESKDAKEFREFPEKPVAKPKSSALDPSEEKAVKIAIRRIFEGDLIIML